MTKPERYYIRVLPLAEDMGWAEVAAHINDFSPDAELERHPKGGWSLWLPEPVDRAALAEKLDAAGLQIVI